MNKFRLLGQVRWIIWRIPRKGVYDKLWPCQDFSKHSLNSGLSSNFKRVLVQGK